MAASRRTLGGMPLGVLGTQIQVLEPKREIKGDANNLRRLGMLTTIAEGGVCFQEVTICGLQTVLLNEKKTSRFFSVYLLDNNSPAETKRIKWVQVETPS